MDELSFKKKKKSKEVQETGHILSNVSDLFLYRSIFLYKVRVRDDVALKRSQLCPSEVSFCCALENVSLFFF